MWRRHSRARVDGGVPKVDVLFEGEKKAEPALRNLVRVTVRKIAVGDRLVFKDKNGVEYRYEATENRAHGGFLEGRKQKTWRRRQQYKRSDGSARQSNTMSARVYYNERDPPLRMAAGTHGQGLIPKEHR